MTNKILLYWLSLLCFSMPVSANEDWRDNVHFMKLLDKLDRKHDGYCLDIVGVGNNVRLDMPLITHNCKVEDDFPVDELLIHRKDRTIYFPAYEGCATVMGLNNNALPYNALMLKRCHKDQPFLKATKFQKFLINKNQQLQLEGTSLCITAGDIAKSTYSPAHRWRSLYMQECSVAKPNLSQWHFVKR